MARPSKLNDEIKLKLADFVRSGLTIKDSCEAAGISDSTFNRWRCKDPEFNALIDEATKKGWDNAEAFAKYHYRGYKRKVTHHLPSLPTDPPLRPSGAPIEQVNKQYESHNDRQMICGLPVLFTYPSERPSKLYFNGNSHMVEWFDKTGVLHAMRRDVYERKYLHKTDNDFFAIIV